MNTHYHTEMRCQRGKLAFEEEIMTSNPCAKIGDEPEKARERYLTSHEEKCLAETMKDDLAFLRLPFEVSLHTGMRKNIELLKLKVEHLNFSSNWMNSFIRQGLFPQFPFRLPSLLCYNPPIGYLFQSSPAKRSSRNLGRLWTKARRTIEAFDAGVGMTSDRARRQASWYEAAKECNWGHSGAIQIGNVIV
jgi:hypothetical protein